MDWLRLALFSPLIAAPICALIFWLAVRRFGLNTGKALDELAGHLFFWSVLGILVGIALPIFYLFYYSSNIAPIFAFFSVPAGLSVGAIVATVVWRLHADEA